MLSPIIRARLTNALGGLPAVLDALFSTMPPRSTRWNFRSAPDRFTLREILAHMADYDDIWNEYVTAVLRDEDPVLVPRSPDALAMENDYAHSDPAVSLARLRKSRPTLAAMADVLTDAQWERSGTHVRLGRLSAETLCITIVAHDGYHTRQVAEYVMDSSRATGTTT